MHINEMKIIILNSNLEWIIIIKCKNKIIRTSGLIKSITYINKMKIRRLFKKKIRIRDIVHFR